MNKKHFNIQIMGFVREVAFPFQIMKKADELQINGFAGYYKSNSIKIEAEGDESKMNEFLSWCRIGVPGAKIFEIKHEEFECVDYKEFVIKEKVK